MTQRDEALERLREEARSCTACPLYRNATQTVFGEGAGTAPLVLVGEQPGDQEDLQGHPFVGPAGGVLDRALGEAGISPRGVYVTNAVKHFKFEQRGKRRIHQKPNRTEIVACRPWLWSELEVVDPTVVVALGVTAATSLLERAVTLKSIRGHPVEWAGTGQLVATVHPSAVLRADDGEDREHVYNGLVADLRFAQSLNAPVAQRRS